VSEPKQYSRSPNSGGAKGEQENNAHATSRDSGFAPALEHGNESTDKKNNCDDAKDFQHLNLSSRLCSLNVVSFAVTRITAHKHDWVFRVLCGTSLWTQRLKSP